MNSLFLNALSAKNKARPPIWLLRQAGRYMPSYQSLRARYGSDALFHESDLITTITLLPIEELGVDAAILFSDILMVLETLGVSWKLIDGVGPLIEKPLTSLTSLQKKETSLPFQPLRIAIKNLKSRLTVPLIGFAGGPFTLACYLIEGGKPGKLKKTKEWMRSDPSSFHELLSILSNTVAEWLSQQIEAGVDAIQIFDTHAGELEMEEFTTFALPSLHSILEKIPKIPKLVYAKKSASFAPLLAHLPCQGLSVDESVKLSALRAQIPLPMALQGNLDPSLLFDSKEAISKRVKELLSSMRGDPAFIVNVGSGLTQKIPFDKVKFLVDSVKANES